MGFPCFGDSGVDLEAWMTVIVEPRRENALNAGVPDGQSAG